MPSPVIVPGLQGGGHGLQNGKALLLDLLPFLLFLFPATRRNLWTLNLGCLLIYSSVYIEKGMALVIPGMTPDTLGEIYEYVPTLVEVRIGAGIFAVGFLVFTLLCKVAIPLLQEPETAVENIQEGEPAAA